MESRLGHDFSQVRIHADAPAHQAARALQAQAYTLGTDIVFAAGRYEPDTHEGRRLLAHELVHVVQQQGSAQHVQRQPEDGTDVPAPEVPGAPDPALELGEQNKNTEVACKAFASMIRATEGICRVAGEDSPECEKATTRVRGHAGTLGPLCNSTMPQIVFKEQRTSGAACGSNATLGVGGFSLTNPEEMVYHVPPYARCFLDQFEIRRTVQDETYEKVGGTWRQVASTPAGTDDTPGPNPYADCMKPPYLRSYDSPGWVYNTRQLSVGAGGLKTSPNATEVQLSLNFFEWVRATGPGRMVTSDKAEWSTVLRLVWSGTAWKFAPGSSISLGHVKLGPPA